MSVYVLFNKEIMKISPLFILLLIPLTVFNNEFVNVKVWYVKKLVTDIFISDKRGQVSRPSRLNKILALYLLVLIRRQIFMVNIIQNF